MSDAPKPLRASGTNHAFINGLAETCGLSQVDTLDALLDACRENKGFFTSQMRRIADKRGIPLGEALPEAAGYVLKVAAGRLATLYKYADTQKEQTAPAKPTKKAPAKKATPAKQKASAQQQTAGGPRKNAGPNKAKAKHKAAPVLQLAPPPPAEAMGAESAAP